MSINTRLYYRFFGLTILGWLMLVCASAWWGWMGDNHHIDVLAHAEALANCNKDVAFRFWATSHGGVYVPITDRTPPNEHLDHIPERDIMTPSGKKLTLMNPAYMVRQMHEDFDRLYGIQGRITSLKTLNPNNAPDEWEVKALQAFENGIEEVMEYHKINGTPYIRLMRPLVAKKGCLKCHKHQGYKVGDIRGGVGVNIPLTQLYEHLDQERLQLIIQHLVVGLLGLSTLLIGGSKLGSELTRRITLEDKMRDANDQLQHANDRLQYQESQIRLLMNSAAEGIIGTDKTGICTFVNDSALTLLEASEEEVLGRDLRQLLQYDGDTPYGNSLESPQFQLVMAGKVIHKESSHMKSVGRGFKPVEYWLHPIANGEQIEGVICTFIDISKRVVAQKKLEDTLASLDAVVKQRTQELEERVDELHRTQNVLVESEKMASLGRMVAGLAHEINTPIGIVVGGASHVVQSTQRLMRLLQNDEIDEAEILPLIQGIEASAQLSLNNSQKAAALVARMKRTSIDDQSEPLHRMELCKILEDSMSLQQFALNQHQVEVRLECSEGLTWFGRAQEVHQVLSQLVENSIKHGFADSMSGREILLEAYAKDNNIIIHYRDNGVGLALDQVTSLFEPFSGRKGKKGVGLGMFTIFNTVTVQMHGTIEVEQGLEEGCGFYIYLPFNNVS